MSYMDIRKKLLEINGDNSDDDDVIDAIVEVTADIEHFTDAQLEKLLESYRLYEKAFPEIKKKGDTLSRP